MSTSGEAGPAGPGNSPPAGSQSGVRTISRPVQALIVTSVMFTFISYWRTAAVVLCDIASTVYYIGGIVEQAIGPAAPWFILAVMLFSYAVRSVYIESCTLFVRGGVYRVVREAMGGFMAKFAVSALLFDYMLTAPISGVSAGQYIIGLGLESIRVFNFDIYTKLGLESDALRESIRRAGSVLIASGIVLYFFRQNLIGIHESSGKALKIMLLTTIMGVIVIAWSLFTLAMTGPVNSVFRAPNLDKKYEYQTVQGVDRITGEPKDLWERNPETGKLVPKTEDGKPVPKIDPVTGEQVDPLGFLAYLLPASVADHLRHPASWLSLIGVLGLFIAFGHSILAMSGEETLAQVYREVESPKLTNFKKAAFIVFIYSLVLTGGVSFLAVMLIPDEVRMKDYADNLLGGLAMHMWGWDSARLILNAFVVIVGFLILAGACNTSIIGSNGVLNRVAEDGVLPDWLRRPHPHYGTTYRILYLIVALQIFTIVITWGDVLILGEAYAFGVVWSFVFQAISMVMLRFKDRRPREYKVPLNFTVGGVEVPVGLILILIVLLITAVMNVLTKEVATVAGITFTLAFFTVFLVSERYHEQKRKGAEHKHLEQFNEQMANDVSPASLGLVGMYRKLVSIRSTQNLFMLEKALAETDPQTTAVVVMTAKVTPPGEGPATDPGDLPGLDEYDQQLMTAVVDRAEKAGKRVKPLIVPTNNALFAVLKTAKDLQVQELVMGASNKYTADEQMEQIAFYWINLHGGTPAPLTVRILSRDRDIYQDIAGGNRIPKISERRAKTVEELRAAGVGIDRVMLLHDGTQASSDLFKGVLTMLDPDVILTLVPVPPADPEHKVSPGLLQADRERAEKLSRAVNLSMLKGPNPAAEIVRIAREQDYDLIVLALAQDRSGAACLQDERANYILSHAHCRVFLAASPVIPHEVVDTQQPSS